MNKYCSYTIFISLSKFSQAGGIICLAVSEVSYECIFNLNEFRILSWLQYRFNAFHIELAIIQYLEEIVVEFSGNHTFFLVGGRCVNQICVFFENIFKLPNTPTHAAKTRGEEYFENSIVIYFSQYFQSIKALILEKIYWIGDIVFLRKHFGSIFYVSNFSPYKKWIFQQVLNIRQHLMNYFFFHIRMPSILLTVHLIVIYSYKMGMVLKQTHLFLISIAANYFIICDWRNQYEFMVFILAFFIVYFLPCSSSSKCF